MDTESAASVSTGIVSTVCYTASKCSKLVRCGLGSCANEYRVCCICKYRGLHLLCVTLLVSAQSWVGRAWDPGPMDMESAASVSTEG
jgi:hypothetical protein